MAFLTIRNLLFTMVLTGMAGLVPAAAQAQTRVRDTNLNSWYMYFGDHRLSDKWGAHTEVQLRRHDVIRDPQQILLRFGANYHATDRTIFTLGYGYIDTFSGMADEYLPEQRIYQQAQLRDSVGRVTLTHRYRLEQRWVRLAANADYLYLNRARYMLRGVLPLKGDSLEPKEPYLAAYDEVFIGFGNNVPNIFDQNRAYAALGYKPSPESAVEIGYLYQAVQQRNRTVFQHNHTLQFGLTYNFDFR